ncbi:MAG: ATP-dependent Clp protease adaptor ClpS [Bacteroidales bacterium]
MDSNFSYRPNKKRSAQGQTDRGSLLVLHNDDINSIEYVMEVLEEVCDHSITQAEQCAMITHYNGKCEILNRNTGELKMIRKELAARGLTVTIE